MRDTVVCTEPEFRKAGQVFPTVGSAHDWTVVGSEENRVAEAVRASRARVAVLGTAAYRGPLYDALAESAKGDPALIARYGVGCDGIDLERCRELGIVVANTPGTLDVSVAEHAIALLLGLARRIPSLDAETRHGGFASRAGVELGGKRLGVAGFGAIGRRVAMAASRGLGMRVIAFDAVPVTALAARIGRPAMELLAEYGVEECTTDFGSFAARLDALSIHLPGTSETRGYLDTDRLGLLPSWALLVNTSRGSIVDETALFKMLAAGRLAGAALDVFATEPYQPAHPRCDLRTLPNVVLTPHAASNTVEANGRIQAAVLQNIHWFLAGDYHKITRVS